MNIVRLTGLAALILVAACKPEPVATGAPPPDVAAPAPAPASPSRFSVPLQYDITAVLRIVERVVPTRFGSLDSVKMMGNDDHRHYAFEATRGPFTAFARGDRVHLRATISYAARGYFKPRIGPTLSAGCGQGSDRPRITVELATPLALTRDWHLQTRASLVSLVPASTAGRDRCDVSIFHRDVTPMVISAARGALQDRLPSIDRRVSDVDLTERATGWWKLLNTPIRLTDGVWLVLGPEQLSVGQVTGERQRLTIPASLGARPRIVTSASPPPVVPTRLPPLERGSAGDGYHITMDGIVDYGTASRQLTAALAARTFSQSGHSVTLTRATIRPRAQGRLGVSLEFTGDARGTL
ncbi:MAG: DUF4403 family protein, partial [Gemmatimonadaceae bacterium]|nr:DUF4403 family protein [Gemmatimonadaceae bacterium]